MMEGWRVVGLHKWHFGEEKRKGLLSLMRDPTHCSPEKPNIEVFQGNEILVMY
jgi:hypothetical protein